MKTKLLLAALFISMITLSFECENDPTDVADKRDNIVGSWVCQLDDGITSYEVVISKNASDETKINIENFANNGSTAYATITSLNLTVPEQQVGNSIVSGDATISDNYQSISWSISQDGEDFTAQYTPGGITKDAQAR